MNQRMLCTCAMAVLAVLTPVKTPESRAGAPACPDGMERVAEYRLFFGRSKQGVEVVDDAAWRAFLEKEVTPRFPGGLTVLDASGQWRDAAKTPVRERTKLVLILAEPGPGGMRRTKEIAEAYKRAFGQESVLRVIGTACASF